MATENEKAQALTELSRAAQAAQRAHGKFETAEKDYRRARQHYVAAKGRWFDMCAEVAEGSGLYSGRTAAAQAAGEADG